MFEDYEDNSFKDISWELINHYCKENPNFLVAHHLDSYNDFINKGIFNVFKENGTIKYVSITKNDDELPNELTLYLGGRDGNRIYFGKPVIFDQSHSHLMYPNDARLRNMNYAATIHFDVDVDFEYNEPSTNGQNTTDRKKHSITLDKIYLGKFPIMIQSCLCILQGMDRHTRYQMGECLNDYGGYFIIDGNEKVIVSQEKFADNMMYIRQNKSDDVYSHSAEIRSKSEDTSKPIRTTSVKIVAPNGTWSNKQIVVVVPNVRKPVPLFILMRALGITSDEDIIRTCLLDLDKNQNMVDLFIPSVHDASPIYNQETAIKYIASFTKRGTIAGTMEILSDYLLPHIGELNFINKAYFIGLMTYKMLKVYIKNAPPTDRDNFQYKRIELAGELLYSLFREYFLIYRKAIYQEINQKEYYHRGEYENNFTSLIEANVDDIFVIKSKDKKKTIRIVEDGFRKAFKGNWGSQENTKREGVVQEINRLSWNTFISHLRKLNLPLDSSAKVVGPRLLNPSQWGFIDPIDTPDGANIGLQKHMALGCRVTSGFSSIPIIKWLKKNIPIKWLAECTPEYLFNITKVIINGNWIGAIENALEIEWLLKLYRRNGILPAYMSISFNYDNNELYLYTDSGRLIRPIYYILRSNTTLYMTSSATDTIRVPSYQRALIKKAFSENKINWQQIVSGLKEKGSANFSINDNKIYEIYELYSDMKNMSRDEIYNELVKYASVIDYVDTSEEDSALIALSDDGFYLATNKLKMEHHSSHSLKEYSGGTRSKNKNNDMNIDTSTKIHLANKFYTHIEIEPALMLGVMGNQIIFPENNPLTRNAFSCGQSKQAVSVYHTNYAMRMDKMGVILNYGQTPLVKSRLLENINHEEQPYGINTIVAIMCYTGYNVEDAVLINEGALKRGLFQTTYFTTYETHEESSKVTGGSHSKFGNIEKNNVIGIKPGYDYSHLDDNGMIKEGTPVNDKTVLIGKLLANPENKDIWIDASETPKKGQLGFVDKSFITEGEEGFNVAKVRIFEQRIPAIGDKFASRSGQKGTIGYIVPEADMPFTADGIRPHIIINPHAIPSRMTVGQIIESLLGKLCLHYGGFGDCTAFQSRGINYYNYAPHLLRAGYSFSGNELLHNGMTGAQIKSDIYIGPTYYMRLKHMVKDKINYRALGPRAQLTRQTVGGRANDGGLRIGEMERDGILAHGMTMVLNDSFLTRGDEYYMAICNKTGTIAIYNESHNLFLSPMADGPIQFVSSNSIVSNNNVADGGTLSVKNISRFGQSFSIIRIPYAFKLLMQELQVMNIQMRIITDQNIGQLMNMSYSFNIDKLMQTQTVFQYDNAAIDNEKVKEQIEITLKEIHAVLSNEQNLNNNVESEILQTPKSYLKSIAMTTNPILKNSADVDMDVDMDEDEDEDKDIDLETNKVQSYAVEGEVSPLNKDDNYSSLSSLSSLSSPLNGPIQDSANNKNINENINENNDEEYSYLESRTESNKSIPSSSSSPTIIVKKINRPFSNDNGDNGDINNDSDFKIVKEQIMKPYRPSIPDILDVKPDINNKDSSDNAELKNSKTPESDTKTLTIH